MPDKAVISHRGEKYEVGRGKRFYGIWVIGAPYEAPVDRWPENQDGWQQAWARFTAIEVPGTIQPVARERKSLRFGSARRDGVQRGGAQEGSAGAENSDSGNFVSGSPASDGPIPGSPIPGGPISGSTVPRVRRGGWLLAGEALLVLGVVLGIAGLFPAYDGGRSLVSQPDQVVAHLFDVIGWAVTAGLVALSVARPSKAARLGALFGLGLSAVTFGMFLGDLGQVTVTGVSLGTGLIVSSVGWLACTAGAGLVLGARTGPITPYDQSRPMRPGPGQAGPVTLLVLAAVGTAAAFAPSWDSYVLTAGGATQTVTAGNAFDNPGLTIAGNVLVMVGVVAVAVLAALWRPARHGALLLAGAAVPLVAQVVSAMVQAGETPSPGQFGFSAAQASAMGLTITSGLTGIFWVYFVFVISLLVSCAWLFTEPGRTAIPGIGVPPWPPAGGFPGTPAAFAGSMHSASVPGASVPGASVPEGVPAAATGREDTGTEDKGGGNGADSDSTESDAASTGAGDSDSGTADGGQSAYA